MAVMRKSEARQSTKRRHSVAVAAPTKSQQEAKHLRLADDLDTRSVIYYPIQNDDIDSEFCMSQDYPRGFPVSDQEEKKKLRRCATQI